MNTIASYAIEESEHDADHSYAYYQQRATRHQQEADRLTRLGDDRQAAIHASISQKHWDKAKALELTEVNR